jgi:hypothetical protein
MMTWMKGEIGDGREEGSVLVTTDEKLESNHEEG